MRDAMRAIRRRVQIPAVAVALAVLYTVLIVASIASTVGAIGFVYVRIGPYAAAFVGGIIAFAISYVGIRVVDAVSGGRNE